MLKTLICRADFWKKFTFLNIFLNFHKKLCIVNDLQFSSLSNRKIRSHWNNFRLWAFHIEFQMNQSDSKHLYLMSVAFHVSSWQVLTESTRFFIRKILGKTQNHIKSILIRENRVRENFRVIFDVFFFIFFYSPVILSRGNHDTLNYVLNFLFVILNFFMLFVEIHFFHMEIWG